MAVSGIPGDISLLSLSFLTEFFSMILLLCISITFSPFYSVILESRGTIDSPVLLPGMWPLHFLGQRALLCNKYSLLEF